MSKLDSATAIGLPSRRHFLTRATAGLAGGLVAAAAIGGPAVASLPAEPVAETPDPVIALAERFLEADQESTAAYIALDEFEPMHKWREKNPEPKMREFPLHPRAALNMNFDRVKNDDIFFDRETGERLTQEQVHGSTQERALAEQDHKDALRKWNRRRQAAERRTGYRKLEIANEEARRRFHEAQDALCDAIPLTWTGLAAKARAFRKTYGDSEHYLMRALMLDIAVLSGQLDRASARPEGDEEYANA
jgi:hypothetical protein